MLLAAAHLEESVRVFDATFPGQTSALLVTLRMRHYDISDHFDVLPVSKGGFDASVRYRLYLDVFFSQPGDGIEDQVCINHCHESKRTRSFPKADNTENVPSRWSC